MILWGILYFSTFVRNNTAFRSNDKAASMAYSVWGLCCSRQNQLENCELFNYFLSEKIYQAWQMFTKSRENVPHDALCSKMGFSRN